MSTLTKAEKIAIAEEEVKTAEIMIAATRKDLQSWIDRLEVRLENLNRLKGVK